MALIPTAKQWPFNVDCGSINVLSVRRVRAIVH
jgi:hypothetical protein